MPLAIYGIVLIVAMLAWPSGIQGAIRALAGRAVAARRGRRVVDAEVPRH
jgi:hypothetical protein